MYPRVARPVQQLNAIGARGGVPKGERGEAAAAVAGVAERGMKQDGGGGKASESVEALRARVKARKGSASEGPQDPRSRLNRHLRVRGFEIKDVPGDNNCQFHAVADQLQQVGQQGWTALKLRQKTVAWLKANGDRPMDDGKVQARILGTQ